MTPGQTEPDRARESKARAVLAFFRSRLREAFGPVFWGFAAIAIAAGLACYLVLGPEAFGQAVDGDIDLLLNVLPRIFAAVIVAGLIRVLLPRDKVAALLGARSGLRGLAIAALAGMVTPGGPFTAFAFMAVLRDSGIDRGTLVAYATGWSLLGVQRILVWDLPLMGADFTLLRFAVSVPLPILAGWLARKIPIEPFPQGTPRGEDDR